MMMFGRKIDFVIEELEVIVYVDVKGEFDALCWFVDWGKIYIGTKGSVCYGYLIIINEIKSRDIW